MYQSFNLGVETVASVLEEAQPRSLRGRKRPSAVGGDVTLCTAALLCCFLALPSQGPVLAVGWPMCSFLLPSSSLPFSRTFPLFILFLSYS